MVNSMHGGDIYSRKIRYDFSANLNPLGMPESVKKAVIESVKNCESYPDHFCRKLCRAIAEYEDFPAEKIVCGNGAADLVYRLVSALKPKKAVIAVPTFSEYEKALTENNTEIIKHYLSEENEFAADISILDYLENEIDMLFMCSPNNPTGKIIEENLLEAIAEKCRRNDIIFVCDECFLPFAVDSVSKSVRRFINENIVILKAFTKIFSMAGLRLGYALFGNAELADILRNTGQFWSVSVPAQTAGIAALNEYDYIEKTVKLINTEREFLISELKNFGFKVYDSEANFILFRCEIPLDEMLLKEKIAIRNCNNYDGLGDGFFRIAVRNRNENEILISAVRRCMNG